MPDHHHEYDERDQVSGPHIHATPKSGQYRAFAIGIGLNVLYLIAEAIAGFFSGSIALLADAAHNLGDVLGLTLAWIAVWLSNRPATIRRSYGHGRTTILAALSNALLVFVTVGGLAWEAVRHLLHPSPVTGWLVMVAAGVGVVVNMGSALLFLRDSEHDINRRGALLHLMTDAAVSLAVVVAGGIILWTGWMWIDPAMALIVSVMVIVATWGLLRESLNLLLDAVPESIDPSQVQVFLLQQPGVLTVHDLHIWALSTTKNALSGHLVMVPGSPVPDFAVLSTKLLEQFRIDHVTIQTEYGIACSTDCATKELS